MLRDRLVCGIHDQRTQRRLLAETDLTLHKAFEVAQAIQSAESKVKELQQPGRAVVHAKSPHIDRFAEQPEPRQHAVRTQVN